MIRFDWDEIANEQLPLFGVLRNRRSRETGSYPRPLGGRDVTLSQFKEAWPRKGTKKILQNIVYQNVEYKKTPRRLSLGILGIQGGTGDLNLVPRVLSLICQIDCA